MMFGDPVALVAEAIGQPSDSIVLRKASAVVNPAGTGDWSMIESFIGL